jgi:hypothetical protein
MNLETFEANQPLTGTIDEQRWKRREAFWRFLMDVMKRRLSEAEIAELRERLRERKKVSA